MGHKTGRGHASNYSLGLASRQFSRSSDITVTHPDGTVETLSKHDLRAARKAARLRTKSS